MRTLIVLFILSWPLPVMAQSAEWQLALMPDGTYYQEGGQLVVFDLEAELFDGDRCVGFEETGPSTCLPNPGDRFDELVEVKTTDLWGCPKFQSGADFVNDGTGKVKPKKKPEPAEVERSGTPIGAYIGAGGGVLLAAVGVGRAIRSRFTG